MITACKTLDIYIGYWHISVEQTFNIPSTNNTTCIHAWLHGDIKRRLNSQECLLPVTTESFVFYLLPKNWNVKIHRTIILTVVVYVCETWSLTMREEHMLWVYINYQLDALIIICS